MKTTSVLPETTTIQGSHHRLRIEVQGVVQGVGYRPFVFGLASHLGLNGFVGNDSHGVFIEVEGTQSALDHFLQALSDNAPPLAFVESIQHHTIPVQQSVDFTIVQSNPQPAAHTLISPDLSICDACLAELFDPANRRYRYPFINCTHCGPRFTITRDIPYDRPLTTMAGFTMCPNCQSEYENPLDRRFHAQPNACAECGPQVELRIASYELQIVDEAIATAQSLLGDGKIVAVKGLGGFHLACDAGNDAAVQELRRRKGRGDKPLAVMALDLDVVRSFAEVSAAEAELLSSRQRPIVLLRKRADFALSPSIAPGNHYVGVMLPYTPLHYLLLDKQAGRGGDKEARRQGEGENAEYGMRSEDSVSPTTHDSQFAIRNSQFIFVMTSANLSDEPIVKENDEAMDRLSELADAILLHNRPIHARCDDSVLRVLPSDASDASDVTFQSSCHPVTLSPCHVLPLRRSRGYAPFPIKLPFALPPILAVGGELKSTFCLTVDNHAFMSQHIGDMENLETLDAFGESVAHFKSIFRTEPALIACDLHPGYLSAKWARQHAQGVPVVEVQHHHAHIAALMAEHGLDGSQPVIGFSFDGTGYGTDGAIWGGEVLIADYRGFERAAHLKYSPLPGGDAAVKRPYRQALAQLWAAGVAWDALLPPVTASSESERNVLLRQFEGGFNVVSTSSMGRLFDAVASLIGVRQTVTYEGQAAIEMESLSAPTAEGVYYFDLLGDAPLCFDAAPLIRAIAADVLKGVPTAVIAARFHQSVAELIVRLALILQKRTSLQTVALSGGVFQNVLLLQLTIARLRAKGFTVLTHHLVPPNDGGLALGQAVVASFSKTVGQ